MTVELPILLAAALVLAAKVTLLLGLASLASVALRHHGAAARHGVWTLAVAGVLALPTLSATPFGRWDVPMPFAFSGAATETPYPPAMETVSADAHLAGAAVAPVAVPATATRLGFPADVAPPAEAVALTPAESYGTPVAYVDAQPEPVTVDFLGAEPALAPVAPTPLPDAAVAPAAQGSLAGGMARTLFWTWIAGCLAVLGWMAAGRAGLAALGRRARPVEGAEWTALLKDAVWMLDIDRPVRLLRSDEATMPMAWGILRPVVLLPAEADEWPEDRRSHVLLHELSHVARHDALTQLLAGIACALHWFNPAVWYAARRLRVERERACDERVLSLGAEPRDYAQHLLELARRFRPLRSAPLVSVTMARPSHLEGRLLAILNHVRGAGRLSRAAALGGIGVAAAAVLALGAMRPVPASAATPAADLAPVAPALAGMAVATDDASGDTTFRATFGARPGGTLVLDLRTGASVRITGTDGDQVEIRGRLSGRDWRDTDWNVTNDDGSVRLETFFRTHRRSQSTSHSLDIRVPRRYHVQLASAGGELTITGVEGTFRGHTGGGEISLQRLSGTARLTTGGGDVTVADCRLDGTVTTGGGRVTMRNVSGGLRGASGSDVGHVGADGAWSHDGFDAETMAEIQAAQAEVRREMSKMDAEMRRDMDDAQREALEAQREALQARHEALAALDEMDLADTVELEDLNDEERERVMEALEALHDVQADLDLDVEIDAGDVSELVSAATTVGLQAALEGLAQASDALRAEGHARSADRARVSASSARASANARASASAAASASARAAASADARAAGAARARARAEDRRGGERTIALAGGAISLDSAPNGAVLHTGGGPITVGRARGNVTVATGSGAVRVGPALASVAAASGSGDVTVVVDRRGAASRVIDAGTGNGTVTVVLPRGMGVTLDLETAYTRGRAATRIRGAEGVATTATEAWDDRHGTPRRYVRARGSVNGGGPTVRVRAVNGDVVIRREP